MKPHTHHDNEYVEVESEEKQNGEEIEVDEERLPSQAMATHEVIRQEGEKELERDAMALLWSAIAAGLSMGASLVAKGICASDVPEARPPKPTNAASNSADTNKNPPTI